MLEGHVLFEAELVHQVGDGAAAEAAHQVVFERDVEPRGARVALAAGATAQLVVDPPRLVALGADDVEAARVDHPLVIAVAELAATSRATASISSGSASSRDLNLRRTVLSVKAGRVAARAGCRRRGRPCSWRSSRRRAGPPAR